MVGLHRDGGASVSCSADGSALEVDRAVLCIGNFPRAAPFAPVAALDASPRFIGDPWDDAAFARIGPGDSVVLVGTGLTMADVVIDLASRGHRGPLRAFSQRGLLPQVHQQTRAYPAFLRRDALPATALGQLCLIKREVRRAAAAGFDWRSVLDTSGRWCRTSGRRSRSRSAAGSCAGSALLGRAPPPHGARQCQSDRELRRAGSLAIAAARPEAVAVAERQITLTSRPRGGGARFTWQADWLINCSGPECDYTRIDHPLIRCLLDAGSARPDPLRLGIDVGPDFALIAADGTPSAAMFALGPPTRGALWEITAVPDIRKQCAALASQLALLPQIEHNDSVIAL